MLSDFSRKVLDLVDLIPAGRVMSYGDIAELLGTRGARAVGTVMANHGHEVPWHRVVTADGRVPRHAQQEALTRLRAEGVPMIADKVDMSRARWSPDTMAS